MKIITSLIKTVLFAALLCCCRTTGKKDTGEAVSAREIVKSTPSNLPGTLPSAIEPATLLKEEVLIRYVHQAHNIRPNKGNGLPFEQMNYDQLIAYDFWGDEEKYDQVIDHNGSFVPVITGQQALTQAQADRILATLSDIATYGGGTASCFRPHFALVFFKNSRIVSQINFCLSCNYLISESVIPAQTHWKRNKGTEREYPLNGFSEKGKEAITALCKELGFYYGQ